MVIHLIDGTYELFRQFYGRRRAGGGDRRYGAVIGVLHSLLQMVADISKFHRQVAGKKVHVVGEFGFIPLDGVEKVLDAVISNGLTGALVWSLRFHNRDGGFYWHTEGASSNAFKAYHYPGFATGLTYQESDLLKLMRAKAFAIRGLPIPALEAPAPPVLLPIQSAAEIAWQGSVGAASYDVERARSLNGPWTDSVRHEYR